jgi:hypothetical protein
MNTAAPHFDSAVVGGLADLLSKLMRPNKVAPLEEEETFLAPEEVYQPPLWYSRLQVLKYLWTILGFYAIFTLFYADFTLFE